MQQQQFVPSQIDDMARWLRTAVSAIAILGWTRSGLNRRSLFMPRLRARRVWSAREMDAGRSGVAE